MSAERHAQIREDARRRIVEAAVRCEEELALAARAEAAGLTAEAATHRANAELDSTIAFLSRSLAL
jgi:hypothetical protein